MSKQDEKAKRIKGEGEREVEGEGEGEGVEFPLINGRKSSTEVGKAILARANGSIGGEEEAKKIFSEKNWRKNYISHIIQHVRLSLQSSEAALTAAREGLEECYKQLHFVRNSKLYTLDEALAKWGPNGSEISPHSPLPYKTIRIKGTSRLSNEMNLPYHQKLLNEKQLCELLSKWAKNGTIEKDVEISINEMIKNKEKYLDLSNYYFVLLGAGAAIGPFETLIHYGANIIAVDIPNPSLWQRLLHIAISSPGHLILPSSNFQKYQNNNNNININNDNNSENNDKKNEMIEIKGDELNEEEMKRIAEGAGCNLLKETPEIARWIFNLFPDQPLCIGNYVYLDGIDFVRITIACDMLIKSLSLHRSFSYNNNKNNNNNENNGNNKNRGNKDGISLSFLCSPTDCLVVPDDAREFAERNYSSFYWKKLIDWPIQFATFFNYLQKNSNFVITNDGEKISFSNGLVVQQGPNYALAKRIQHWRSIIALNDGHVVSSNVAPSTQTNSVVKNRSFAWAYDGISFFDPIEIFQRETCNVLMTWLLIHHLRSENSVKSPNYRRRNPLELMASTGVHGGLWRSAYTMGSIAVVSAVLHFVKLPFTPFLKIRSSL